MVRYCPHCWAEVADAVERCSLCGTALTEATDDLVLRYAAALRHREPTLACLACDMLAELGDRRAVPALIALVESRPHAYEVLCAAIESLSVLGDVAAIPALQAVLRDPEVFIPARLAALRALVHFGGSPAETALRWAAASERPSLVQEAALLQGAEWEEMNR